MADISWTGAALAMFSPEERECAATGGTWDRGTSQCVRRVFLPPALPPATVTTQLGTVDPQQMFDDGFVYLDGKWIKADEAEKLLAARSRPPGMASVLPQLAGSVLGVPIPTAAPVALPSFVGGRLGQVRVGGGLRPESGGQERVRFGPAILPVVRWT